PAYGTAALIAKNSGVVNGAISSGGAPKPAASPAAKRARSVGPITRTWPATASSARGAGWAGAGPGAAWPGWPRRSMSGRTSRALSPYWPPSSSAPASGSPRHWMHHGTVSPARLAATPARSARAGRATSVNTPFKVGTGIPDTTPVTPPVPGTSYMPGISRTSSRRVSTNARAHRSASVVTGQLSSVGTPRHFSGPRGSPVLSPQGSLEDLAGPGHRQLVHDLQAAGRLVAGDLLLAEVAQLIQVE